MTDELSQVELDSNFKFNLNLCRATRARVRVVYSEFVMNPFHRLTGSPADGG